MITLVEAAGVEFSEPLVSNGYVLSNDPARVGRLEPVPELIRTDRNALKPRLEQNGYLFFKRFFNPKKILEFREYYFSSLAPTGLLKPGSNPVEGLAGEGPVDQAKLREILFNDIIKGAEYKALCASPELVEFFEWFLGGQVYLNMRKIVRVCCQLFS